MTSNCEKLIAEVFTLLKKSEEMDYFGEEVSQLAHVLQCAKLAADTGADEETVIAALLHDIGHLCASDDAKRMGTVGVADHETVGANYLRACGFSEKVAQLVQGHVQAKRYLTFKNPRYMAGLSAASLETLAHQGGPMSTQEAETFEHDPLFKAKLRLRSWDEQGKKVGWQVPPLEAYRGMLASHLKRMAGEGK